MNYWHKFKVCGQKKYFLGILFLLISIAISAGADEGSRRLNILTSFPSELYTPFVERFETLYPDIQISILNKKTTAAVDEILRGNGRNFDIFWSSSADAFDILKSGKNLRRSLHSRKTPAVSISTVTLDDPDQFFYGFALSGVGWMWNSEYLTREKLPVPERWEDLANPVYYGHIAMSTPSRSGTTHLIVENFLQKEGWERGWSQLLLMSGNLATVTARSFSVPEGVNSGRFGIGLVIDFLARTEENPHISFSYGRPIFLVPASIASVNNGLNPTEADLFIDFVLSLEGQKLLLLPEINRLPISSQLLSEDRSKASRLLQFIEQNSLPSYNVKLSRERYQLVNQLFDKMITYRLRERRRLWKRLINLERRFGRKSQDMVELGTSVREHLSRIPVSEEQSRSLEFHELLPSILTFETPDSAERKILERWDEFINTELAQVKTLLDEAEKTLSSGKKR